MACSQKPLKLNFFVSPVRDDKYIIAKLKIFKNVNMTTFTNNVIPIEKTHYTCISAIDIDSVLKIDTKAFPQAYLEQCKYKLKKKNLYILLILKLLMMAMIMKLLMIKMIIKMMMVILVIMEEW